MNLRLRHLAEVNPATPEFDQLAPDDRITFMPLEAVWSDSRVDMTRARCKVDVAVGYSRFREGDVIVPKVAPTFQAGRAAVAKNLLNGVGAGSTELHVLRPRADNDARFISYLVRSSPFLTEGVSAFQGVAGLQRVTDDFVRDFPVLELSVEEQRRIADYLDGETSRLDVASASIQAQTLMVEERFTNELVSTVLTPSGLRTSSTRVKYLFEFKKSGVWGEEPCGDDDDVRCVRVADFRRSEFRAGRTAKTMRSVPRSMLNGRLLKFGDVLLEMSGGGDANPVGFAVSFDGFERSVCSNFVAALRPATGVCDRYAALLMASMYKAGRNRPYIKQTTGIQNLDSNAYLSQRLEVPSRKDQQDIAEDLDRSLEWCERVVRNRSRQLALLAERRQALITAAVMGQIDVTTAGR